MLKSTAVNACMKHNLFYFYAYIRCYLNPLTPEIHNKLRWFPSGRINHRTIFNFFLFCLNFKTCKCHHHTNVPIAQLANQGYKTNIYVFALTFTSVQTHQCHSFFYNCIYVRNCFVSMHYLKINLPMYTKSYTFTIFSAWAFAK